MSSAVTLTNIEIGARVVRHPHNWRRGKWREGRKGPGVVIGFTDKNGMLRGENSGRDYDTDRINEESGPGWAVVKWEESGIKSVYPVGAEGPLGAWWRGGPCYSLLFASATNDQF